MFPQSMRLLVSADNDSPGGCKSSPERIRRRGSKSSVQFQTNSSKIGISVPLRSTNGIAHILSASVSVSVVVGHIAMSHVCRR